MTLPVNIRALVKVGFPTQVYGSGFVVVTKANGIWTVSADYTKLAALVLPVDLTQYDIAVQNITTKAFSSLTAAAFLGSIENNYREVTAAGDVTIAANDVGILLNKAAGAATNINLPAAATRNGAPVWVKDYKGDANVNNITFVMAGVETVDGFTQAQANANGRSKLTIAYGAKVFYPRVLGGWYIR